MKDGLPLVDDLIHFLRDGCRGVKLVGICFGHQVMAQAFDGDVAKAPHGWGFGLQRYDIVARADWMDEPAGEIWGTASQGPGPDATAGEDRPAVSVQFHPEFTPDLSRALLRMRRAPHLSPDKRAHAIASLATANDNVWRNG